MAYTVILHIPGEDAIFADMEELPKSGDTFVTVTNMRRGDGSTLGFVDTEAETFLFPWHRVTFIEVRPMEGAKPNVEKFFRE